MRSEGYKVKIFFQAGGYLCLFEDIKKEPSERETLMMWRNKREAIAEKPGGKDVPVALQYCSHPAYFLPCLPVTGNHPPPTPL